MGRNGAMVGSVWEGWSDGSMSGESERLGIRVLGSVSISIPNRFRVEFELGRVQRRRRSAGGRSTGSEERSGECRETDDPLGRSCRGSVEWSSGRELVVQDLVSRDSARLSDWIRVD